MTLNVKDMVKDGKRVKFLYYRQKELWYETETGFKFPVPIDDVGDGTFLAEDKALLFMRYINKQIKLVNEERFLINGNDQILGAANPFAKPDYIGVSITVTGGGTTFNIDVGEHSIPIASSDAEKLTFAQVVDRAFKANE